MSQHFTHLHVHTDFSLLDGAISVDKYVNFAKKHNFRAMGISDHGNIFGAVKFFQACKKANIKPILGIEAYLTEDAKIKSADNKYYHLLLIVENEIGYKNLCKLISFSFQKGFYFKPRIDYNILAQHSEGLIATSACLGGHIPKLIMNDKYEQAHERIDWFLKTFGPDNFYLEVQPEDQKIQAELNQKLYQLSQTKGIPLVATGDCHYVQKDDHQAHEAMLSIQTQGKLDDPSRYTFGDCRVYLRTEQEMLSIFADHTDAIYNSGIIADRCDFDFQTNKLFFPKFDIPQGQTPENYLKQLCEEGFEKLKQNNRFDIQKEGEYKKRLHLEIDLISSMGFVGYFLVVSDFMRWSRAQGIPVGPGRGSAAGSLVAWALEITNIDPIKYNLLFERFLNPERVSMPDIDIDFCIQGREKVINYVRDKYGHDKVCQIITFGTMAAKGVIKDVARVMGIAFEDSNAITSLIGDQLKISLKDAVKQEPRLQEMINNNPKVHTLFDLAFRLEGLTRHASKHAAGIVISPEPIDEVLPVYVPSKTTELVTQYAMTELELLGFLKIDLLGLKNLTLVDRVVRLIKKNHDHHINIDKLPLDDTKTFKLLQQGQTSGVFQLESEGLKEVLRKLKPEKFEDIIAVNALYRPGPLGSGMVDDFIERKHGRQKITYLFAELEPILKETNGVIVYQEQVMKIASAIAGYTLGQADILRRAMGKKKIEVMAAQKELFLKGAQERNFNKQKAEELFDLMAYFAGYGFNKSHSAAYAMIAYQTAYLKANYPDEFMACLISLEATHAEKMAFYLQEAKAMGLPLLPPDINKSEIDFSVVDKQLLFGLQGIKSVGLASLHNIIEQRTKEPFKDLFDFCTRIDLRTSNKRVIEHLIWAGAFDKLPGNRAQQYAEIATIMDRAVAKKRALETGQLDLFGLNGNHEDSKDEIYSFTPLGELPDKEKLEKEKEVVGFYLSSHPLESYKNYLNWLAITPVEDIEKQLEAAQDQFPVLLCAIVNNRKDIITKKGDPMSFITVEDLTGSAEIIVFPRLFKKIEGWLDQYHAFIIGGSVDITAQKCKILANEFMPIELLFQEWKKINGISLHLPATIDEQALQQIKKQFVSGTIQLRFIIEENDKTLQILTKEKIAIDLDILQQFEAQNIKVKLELGF